MTDLTNFTNTSNLNIDLAALLASISADNPVGINLHADTNAITNPSSTPSTLYYQLKDLRSQARIKERKNMQEGETALLTPLDWQPLLKTCIETLTTTTKDLEVASWLLEALVRIHGFAGLRDGLKLLCGLIANFWPQIYPIPDEEGTLAQLAPLIGLSGEEEPGTLIMPINCLPLTSGVPSFAFWQYQKAMELAHTPSQQQKQQSTKDIITLEMIQQAVTVTKASQDFLVSQNQVVLGCQTELAALQKILQEKCGANAPELMHIRRALETCRAACESLIKNFRIITAPTASVLLGQGPASMSAASSNNLIQDREQALQKILEVANFFRVVEPHSPLSYVLEQAARWGRMSLPELMRELILDTNAQFTYCKLVGLQAPINLAPAPTAVNANQPDDSADAEES